MNQAIRVIGVCLLLSGFVVAGCGGDDDGSGGEGATAGAEAGNGQSESADGSGGELEPTSESKEEYVAEANALCRKQKKQIQADLSKLLQTLPEGSPQASARKIVEEGLTPGLEAEVEGLRELGAPEGDEEQIEALLVAIEATLAEAREDPKAFVGNASAFAKTRKLAGEYGIGQCGRPT